VPDGEIVGEGVLLGLPNERCDSQELHICARSGVIFKYTKTADNLPKFLIRWISKYFKICNWYHV